MESSLSLSSSELSWAPRTLENEALVPVLSGEKKTMAEVMGSPPVCVYVQLTTSLSPTT